MNIFNNNIATKGFQAYKKNLYLNFMKSNKIQNTLFKNKCFVISNKNTNKRLNENLTRINKKFSKISLFQNSNVVLFGKLKTNIFIKDITKVEDLKFKEEFFEFISLRTEELTEIDLISIIEKLETHVILESELKEFKFLIRNILEVKNIFNSEYAIMKFIKYFLKTYNSDLKKFFDPNVISVENNKYDVFFDNLNASMFNFALENLMKIENNHNMKYILDLFLLINFSEEKVKKELFEKIQIKFLQNINLNLMNSPLNLKNIVNDGQFGSNENFKEEDLLMFLLINLVLYQENKYLLDVVLEELIKYFDLKLQDRYGLYKYWSSDLNTRPQVFKIDEKELKILNIIYGLLSNWIEFNKKENININQNLTEDQKTPLLKSNFKDNNGKKEEINANSLTINIIISKEQIYIVEGFLRTIEKVVLKNNKITKQKFLKKFNDDLINLKDSINHIEEINKKFMDKMFI